MAIRVLVLEDDALIAGALGDDLRDAGADVVGVFGSCLSALELLWTAPPDLAFLDTMIGDETCEVVLEECRIQGIPTIIFSGHTPETLPEFARGLPVLSKPYLSDQLQSMLDGHQSPQ